MRCSRNSDGPLINRRLRWARSSGGAVASVILSIAFPANSFARAARAAGACVTVFLIVSPSSTSWRIASERLGLVFLLSCPVVDLIQELIGQADCASGIGAS